MADGSYAAPGLETMADGSYAAPGLETMADRHTRPSPLPSPSTPRRSRSRQDGHANGRSMPAHGHVNDRGNPAPASATLPLTRPAGIGSLRATLPADHDVLDRHGAPLDVHRVAGAGLSDAQVEELVGQGLHPDRTLRREAAGELGDVLEHREQARPGFFRKRGEALICIGRDQDAEW